MGAGSWLSGPVPTARQEWRGRRDGGAPLRVVVRGRGGERVRPFRRGPPRKLPPVCEPLTYLPSARVRLVSVVRARVGGWVWVLGCGLQDPSMMRCGALGMSEHRGLTGVGWSSRRRAGPEHATSERSRVRAGGCSSEVSAPVHPCERASPPELKPSSLRVNSTSGAHFPAASALLTARGRTQFHSVPSQNWMP